SVSPSSVRPTPSRKKPGRTHERKTVLVRSAAAATPVGRLLSLLLATSRGRLPSPPPTPDSKPPDPPPQPTPDPPHVAARDAAAACSVEENAAYPMDATDEDASSTASHLALPSVTTGEAMPPLPLPSIAAWEPLPPSSAADAALSLPRRRRRSRPLFWIFNCLTCTSTGKVGSRWTREADI
ncbi:hypothetical protein BRADI_1g55822v3, partial [Brachypodium distachyon]